MDGSSKNSSSVCRTFSVNNDMALVHEKSCESVHTGLDLFALPPTQTAVQDGMWVEFHPLATLAQGAPVEFAISGATSDYLDLSNTFLHVKARVVNPDGTNLAADAAVAPVNYWMHSLLSQVDVLLNDTLVTPSENTYPYRAYIESVLNYGHEAKTTHLTSALFYQDTAGHFESRIGDENLGYGKRRELTAGSRTVDMMGRLHCDIFNQERYLINGVDVKIRLVPSKANFNLMSAADAPFKSTITHASLFVRKVRLNPAVSLGHAKALEKASAKYPLKRVVVKTFSIPTGNIGAVQDNLFLSQTPNRLVIGLVDSAAFNGQNQSNPFHFKTQGLSFLSLYLDGKQVPSKPLQPNYTTGEFVRSYFGLMVSSGLVNQDAGSNISREDFDRGYGLYSVDLTPSLLDDNQLFELVKSGALRMELKFGTALTNSVTVVVWAEMDSMIEIDRSRQVLTDFSL